MKIYITKYALTEGIIKIDADLVPGSTNMVFVKGANYDCYYHRDEWHKTRAEANQRAETMRQRKIVSVKKQLEKLEATSFV
jgi:hypothetical protein